MTECMKNSAYAYKHKLLSTQNFSLFSKYACLFLHFYLGKCFYIFSDNYEQLAAYVCKFKNSVGRKKIKKPVVEK